MDSIKGTIDRIIFHQTSNFSSAGNKYLIASVTYENGSSFSTITVKGEMNSPVFGWTYVFYGSFADTDRGRVFSFESFEPVLPASNAGMADYLSRQVPAIGKVRARLLVDHFGPDTFQILKTNPQRVSEVAGIPSLAQDAVIDFFTNDNTLEVDPAAYSRLFDLLSPIRPPRRIITSLLKNFGSNAPQFITERPYSLLDYPGMGWQRVDQFATQVLKYDRNGIERHRRAIIEALSRLSEHGHTKVDFASLYCDATNLLGLSLSDDAVESMIVDSMIIRDEEDYISSFTLYTAEKEIARELARLQNSDSDFGFAIDDSRLEDEQKLISPMVQFHKVSIISGVAGSGKSVSTAIIVKNLYDNGITNILICAPTGKAAKRNDEFMQQFTGIQVPCSTIHRALMGKMSSEADEGIPEEEARLNRGRNKFSFEYNEHNKLPYEFYVVDESSMLDVSLASSFLRAIPDGSRLLIVGDHRQLPSVGPGSFLRDLIAAGIPCTVLEKPRRNSGAIAHACYMIKEGRQPSPRQLGIEFPDSNWTHVSRENDNDSLETILHTHINYVKKFGNEAAKINLQVVSPEKKGILGCNNLNSVLGKIINPGDETISGSEEESTSIRLGDKVVRNKNGFVKLLTLDPPEIPDSDYDEDRHVGTMFFNGESYYTSKGYVVNGDLGEVVGAKAGEILVRFANPDRLCALPKSEHNISLAYALTCHKMQGSSAPICIIPLTDFYWNTKLNVGLWSRELVYTLLSRPSERLITVGKLSSLYQAISRVTIGRRQTRLESMVRDAIHNYQSQ
jgi:exodeoxyribonuclease V alpha subunit